jgi:hypothetical protein
VVSLVGESVVEAKVWIDGREYNAANGYGVSNLETKTAGGAPILALFEKWAFPTVGSITAGRCSPAPPRPAIKVQRLTSQHAPQPKRFYGQLKICASHTDKNFAKT